MTFLSSSSDMKEGLFNASVKHVVEPEAEGDRII